MYTHVMVGANDLDQSRAFYDAVFGVLGINRVGDEEGRSFYASETGAFGVTKPIDGAAASHANGGTIGFGAADKDQVDAWHAAGLAAGGSCDGAPGPRANAPGNAYGAYLRDPAGNKICVFCQLPA